MDKADELFFLLLEAAPKALLNKGPDLSRGEAAAVRSIAYYKYKKEEDISMRELGVDMSSTKSAATQIVSRMEKKKWVKRRRSQNDKRVVNVVFTAAGEELLCNFMKGALTHIRRAIEILGDSDTAELIRLIRKYLEAAKGEANA